MTGLQEFALLAKEAAAAVDRREAQFPARVDAGKLAPEQAALEIRVWRAIAADWHWVVTLERQTVESVTLEEKLAAIEESLRRADKALNKAFHASDERIRRQWTEGMSMLTIADFFGDDARPFLEAWDRFYAIADLLEWAKRDMPGSDRPPISHYVEREIARNAQDRRRAA